MRPHSLCCFCRFCPYINRPVGKISLTVRNCTLVSLTMTIKKRVNLFFVLYTNGENLAYNNNADLQ